MAEETKKTTTPPPCEEQVVVSVAVEKQLPPQPEPEPESDKPIVVIEKEEEKAAEEEEKVVTESASFKEESNKVDDLIDPEKKALDEFKLLIQEALNTHQFTTPPPPPPIKEEVVVVEEPKKDETPVPVPAEEPKTETVEEKTEQPCEPVAAEPEPVKKEEEPVPPPIVVEDIKETIVHEVTPTVAAVLPETTCIEDEQPKEEVPPEEVSIWGVPLLADERSDVILLKFLRARDFKVKEAFIMLKSVVAWRKEFKIDELLEEEIKIEGLEKVVFVHGVDKEGHPVCYNCFGEFQDKDLYGNCFADVEKREKFLRWYIQLLEKNVRGLDFSPEGICTIVQVTDLKNSPGLILFKKEMRQATNQALQLLQDNYPEFVAKQLFVNVPWWYVAYNRMISPFLTLRTKSKFMFAGPTKTAETLFKYIAPEHVPVQYGGVSKEGESDFTTSDAASEEIIKPACKHTVEFPVTEAGTLIWEARVIGWDVSYGAEFVPSEEGAYTLIVQKARKIGPADELSISCTFKTAGPGKVVLTFDNQTSKKKKLLYRSKAL